MKLYKVFIDDSGSKDYKYPYDREYVDNPPALEENREFWRANYFVLCGVRVREASIPQINDAINQLKLSAFGTKKVELKSEWLRNPEQQRKQYLEKFSVTKKALADFTQKLYTLIASYHKELQLIAVVFDKRFYGGKKRLTLEGTPLAKCTQIIFERLQYLNTYHVVIFDQFERHLKLNRGNHGTIVNVLRSNKDMEQVYVSSYDKIIDLKFAKSCNENFLQIADICAYNIYRQFVDYGRQWQNDNSRALDLYSWFARIRYNFIYSKSDNKVCGIGLICVPDIAKCNWKLRENCPE